MHIIINKCVTPLPGSFDVRQTLTLYGLAKSQPNLLVSAKQRDAVTPALFLPPSNFNPIYRVLVLSYIQTDNSGRWMAPSGRLLRRPRPPSRWTGLSTASTLCRSSTTTSRTGAPKQRASITRECGAGAARLRSETGWGVFGLWPGVLLFFSVRARARVCGVAHFVYLAPVSGVSDASGVYFPSCGSKFHGSPVDQRGREFFPAVLSVFVVTPRWTVDTVPPDTIVDTGPSQEGEAPRPEEADPFLFFTFHCRSVAAAAAAAANAPGCFLPTQPTPGMGCYFC